MNQNKPTNQHQQAKKSKTANQTKTNNQIRRQNRHSFLSQNVTIFDLIELNAVEDLDIYLKMEDPDSLNRMVCKGKSQNSPLHVACLVSSRNTSGGCEEQRVKGERRQKKKQVSWMS